MLRSFLNKITFAFTAILSLVFISSCSTDLDPNDDYKETMVIYGILNPTETVHFIKVNKAFLNTNSNALTIAANTDSTTYKDSLKVELQMLKIAGTDTTIETTYPLRRTVINNKDDDGDFQYPTQVLYKTGNVTINENRIYRVMATNLRTQVSAYGVTPIVKDFFVSQVGGTPFLKSDTARYKKFQPHQVSNYRFELAENAGIYKISLDFDYLEITDGDTAHKTLNWIIQNNLIRKYNPNGDVIVIMQPKNAFFEHLKTNIDPVPAGSNTRRVAGDIRVYVTAGSETMATYFQVNNTFSAITQTRPEFDNITNGAGLFASRRTEVTLARMDQQAIFALRAELPQHKF